MENDERSEFESATDLVGHLTRLGLKAEVIPTGGNCYSASVRLNGFTTLDLNDATGSWGWGIYHEGGHVMSGYWGDATSDEDVADKVKALVAALGYVHD